MHILAVPATSVCRIRFAWCRVLRAHSAERPTGTKHSSARHLVKIFAQVLQQSEEGRQRVRWLVHTVQRSSAERVLSHSAAASGPDFCTESRSGNSLAAVCLQTTHHKYIALRCNLRA